MYGLDGVTFSLGSCYPWQTFTGNWVMWQTSYRYNNDELEIIVSYFAIRILIFSCFFFVFNFKLRKLVFWAVLLNRVIHVDFSTLDHGFCKKLALESSFVGFDSKNNNYNPMVSAVFPRLFGLVRLLYVLSSRKLNWYNYATGRWSFPLEKKS